VHDPRVGTGASENSKAVEAALARRRAPRGLTVASPSSPTLRACAFGALLLGIAACSTQSSPTPALPPPPALHKASAAREGLTDGGSFRITWRPVPDPPPLNELFSVDVAVTGASDRTEPHVVDAVDVDAGMPGHGHGMNTRPITTPLGDGRYSAAGLLFHMPGEWELVVKVTSGELTEVARFTQMVD